MAGGTGGLADEAVMLGDEVVVLAVAQAPADVGRTNDVADQDDGVGRPDRRGRARRLGGADSLGGQAEAVRNNEALVAQRRRQRPVAGWGVHVDQLGPTEAGGGQFGLGAGGARSSDGVGVGACRLIGPAGGRQRVGDDPTDRHGETAGELHAALLAPAGEVDQLIEPLEVGTSAQEECVDGEQPCAQLGGSRQRARRANRGAFDYVPEAIRH